MTLSYQVGGSTYLDIDATLTDPTGHALYEQARKDTGSYSFVAAADGRFEYCFSNQYSSVADKTIRCVFSLSLLKLCRALCDTHLRAGHLVSVLTVTLALISLSFNVHGIIYVAEEGDMSPVEREVRDLAAGVQAIKDEQAYLVVRERLHRNSTCPFPIPLSLSHHDSHWTKH